MGMSAGGRGDDLNSEINVTPLVDVMLVLLIIFMVTAPMMNTGVDLELPEAVAANLEQEDQPLSLRIDKNRKLFLGTTPVKWAELEVKLSTNQRVQTEKQLYIEADKNLPYAVVVQAMAIAQKAGATKLQMLTDPLAGTPEDLDKAIEAAGHGAAPPAVPQ